MWKLTYCLSYILITRSWLCFLSFYFVRKSFAFLGGADDHWSVVRPYQVNYLLGPDKMGKRQATRMPNGLSTSMSSVTLSVFGVVGPTQGVADGEG